MAKGVNCAGASQFLTVPQLTMTLGRIMTMFRVLVVAPERGRDATCHASPANQASHSLQTCHESDCHGFLRHMPIDTRRTPKHTPPSGVPQHASLRYLASGVAGVPLLAGHCL
ncbi:hypothetical protein BaRGS_00004548 [Batillaria attramentaria]|uniref:Uncharacterized protein n=1 Tax=Batillaria attramentaria TaxID=370345 RepID=A0ABD0LX78_9CAEN